MKALYIIATIVALVTIYVVGLRSWLRSKPWARGFFAIMEPIELRLFAKSETILWSRLLIIMGLLPPLLSQMGELNTPDFLALIPEKYKPWATVSFTVVGIISEVLRRQTTLPLALVAVPDAVAADVAAPIRQAEVALKGAVSAVEVAKVEAKQQ